MGRILYTDEARIIPARAGFTGTTGSTARAPTDHPRSRGVYSAPPWSATLRCGSSPLARGLLIGLITALIIGGDHPRSRGVYGIIIPALDPLPGSSPLARGLRPPNPLAPGGERIIPARAGFTRLRRLAAAEHRDHPRSRGVYAPTYLPSAWS